MNFLTLNEQRLARLKRFWPYLKAILIFLLIGGGLALLLHMSNVFGFINEQWIEQNIKQSGWQGGVILFTVLTLATSCGLPRQLAAFSAGYAFGALYGTLLATLATAFGCSLTFFIARLIGKPLMLKYYPEKVALINRFLQHNTFNKTIIIRLLPAGNNFLLNMTAGVGQIKAFTYIFASYIGFFPQMIIFAIMGSGISVLSTWHIAISALLAVIAAGLSLRLYHQYKTELTLQQTP